MHRVLSRPRMPFPPLIFSLKILLIYLGASEHNRGRGTRLSAKSSPGGSIPGP